MDYKTGDILVKDKTHYFYFGSVVFAHALKILDFDESNRIVYDASLSEYIKIDAATGPAACCYKAIKSGSIKQEIRGLERKLHLYGAALQTPHKEWAKNVINNEVCDIQRLIASKKLLINDGAAQQLLDTSENQGVALKAPMYYYYHYIPVTSPSFGNKATLINYHIVHILYYELATAVRRGIQLTAAFSPWFRDLINKLREQIPMAECVQAKAELCYQMGAYKSALSAPP